MNEYFKISMKSLIWYHKLTNMIRITKSCVKQIYLNWMSSRFTINISFHLHACKNQRRKTHLSISSYYITIFVFTHDVQNYYEKHFRITWMYNTLLEFPLWCCLITRDECASLQSRICDVVKMRCKEQEIAHDWDEGIKELK